MKLSYNWLRRYLDIDLPVGELSDILTTIGLEVEGVEEVEAVKGGMQGLVVGHVLECGKHPDADKLSCTLVDVGEAEPLKIVCGAPNVAAGQKVIVATVGTVLYGDDGSSFKIKKAKMRGQESAGMICAEDEIGLGTSHDGIIVLQDNPEVGTPAADYYNLTSDTVFDIGLTPNRSDATSQLGAARDVQAYLRINSDGYYDIKEPNVGGFHVDQEDLDIKVEVLNSAACPRYSGIAITNLKIGPSPEWMQKLLKSVGVKCINNVVDITNYILHEYGQPLHAFDVQKMGGQSIKVQNLPAGTKFTGLDDREFELLADDLMICDSNDNPMCIAGVFGSNNSGVTEKTTAIFLESAHFDAGHVRRTSMKHNLRTDAAKVFEKGSDPNITTLALKRAAALLKEYAGATISSKIVDIYPKEIEPVVIHLRYHNVKRLIGVDIPNQKINDILNALDMEVKPVDSDSIKVIVPTNKADVLREVDVIEEILRIYGFNQVTTPDQIKSNIVYSPSINKQQVINKISDLLVAKGYHEMMGLSLMQSQDIIDKSEYTTDDLVYINNTSNIHLDVMRPDVVLSGLQSILHNQNRQMSNLKMFEFGKSYLKDGEDFKESEKLTLLICGQEQAQSWRTADRPVDYYDIKSSVETVLASMGLTNYQVSETDDTRASFGLKYHRGPANIVTFGALSKRLLKDFGIKTEVFYAEFELKTLLKSLKNSKVSTTEISKYPTMRRDLALVLNKDKKFSEILGLAKKVDKKLIKEINLFDVFESEEHLGIDKKSYAVSFIFEDDSKTLKDKEVDKIMQKLVHTFEQNLQAEIRK